MNPMERMDMARAAWCLAAETHRRVGLRWSVMTATMAEFLASKAALASAERDFNAAERAYDDRRQ